MHSNVVVAHACWSYGSKNCRNRKRSSIVCHSSSSLCNPLDVQTSRGPIHPAVCKIKLRLVWIGKLTPGERSHPAASGLRFCEFVWTGGRSTRCSALHASWRVGGWFLVRRPTETKRVTHSLVCSWTRQCVRLVSRFALELAPAGLKSELRSDIALFVILVTKPCNYCPYSG